MRRILKEAAPLEKYMRQAISAGVIDVSRETDLSTYDYRCVGKWSGWRRRRPPR